MVSTGKDVVRDSVSQGADFVALFEKKKTLMRGNDDGSHGRATKSHTVTQKNQYRNKCVCVSLTCRSTVCNVVMMISYITM